MENEQTPPETPPNAPESTPEAPPQDIPIKQKPPEDGNSPPPAATIVLSGKETEETADLKRKLEAKEKDLEAKEQAVRDRETRLAEREHAAKRTSEVRRAPEKRRWMSGGHFFD